MYHTPDTVAQFLADHAPQEFCPSCLAHALNISLQRVRNDLGRLAQERVLVRIGGTCAVCSRTTATYGLMPDHAEPAEEVVAQYFAASPAGIGLCHSCLAEETRLNYHEARQGAVRLRAAGVIRLTVGHCTRCGRQRALVRREGRSGTAAGGMALGPDRGTV
jgi:hypothetical protein